MKRRDKRYREQRLMFAFGQIMLPLVGIVAVAILILGIKMFFLPPKSGDTSRPAVKQEEPVSASVPKQNSVPSSSAAKEAPKGKVVMAVPVGKAPATEQGVSPSKAEPPTPSNIATSKTTSAVAPPATSAVKETKWCVQVGSFTERARAESVMRSLKEKGYNGLIAQVEVSGKTYFRVRVPAGNSREEANALENKLKGDGFPTLVTPMN
jgi:cell division protein FtsN